MSFERPMTDDDLQAFVDGRLTPTRDAAVRAYLDSHPQAAAEVAAYREQRDALRARLAFKAQEPVPARLRVANVADARKQVVRQRWRAMAAALAWLAVGLGAGWSGRDWLGRDWLGPARTTQASPGSIAADAILAHRVFVVETVHPVEVAAAQEAHLVGWLSKRLGRRLVAPDLSGQGYRLMGGRLLPAGTGPAAQLMYEDEGGARLTLYVRAGGAETAFRFQREGDVSTFFWIDEGSGFAVSAALDRDRLLGLAQAVHRQFEGRGAPEPRTAL